MREDDDLSPPCLLYESPCNMLTPPVIERRDGVIEDDASSTAAKPDFSEERTDRDRALLAFTQNVAGTG